MNGTCIKPLLAAALLWAGSSCTQKAAPAQWPLRLDIEPAVFSTPVPEPVRQAARHATALTVEPICFLRFEEIVIQQGGSAQVRVFVNRPDANIATSAESEGFAGFLAVVPTPSPDGVSRPLSFTMDLGPSLAPALREEEVVLTLVPLGAVGGSAEGSRLQIGRIRFFRP